jgi:heme-degrading monooxygenase HmoA
LITVEIFVRFLLFDVKPWPNAMDQYLDIAASLRPELDASGGCEFLDRFRRIPTNAEDEGWLLSFQFWHDEAALVRWRQNMAHQSAQESGRQSVFEDYRLRVGDVIHSQSREQSAQASREPSACSNFVVMVETKVSDLDLPQLSHTLRFESIYRPGRFLHVGNTTEYGEANDAFMLALRNDATIHAATGAVERNYGMFERKEAPQYFAPQ